MTAAPTKQILMSDMFTSNNDVDSRRLKTSAQDSSYTDALDDQRFIVSASVSVPASNYASLNISNSLDYGLISASVNGEYELFVTDEHSTGVRDGEFLAVNKNLSSPVDGFGKGVIYTPPVTSGRFIAAGVKYIDVNAVCDKSSTPCVTVKNHTAEAQTIIIIAELFEYGDKPDAELIFFGAEQVLFNGEEVYV